MQQPLSGWSAKQSRQGEAQAEAEAQQPMRGAQQGYHQGQAEQRLARTEQPSPTHTRGSTGFEEVCW